MDFIVFVFVALLRVVFHPQPEGRPIQYSFRASGREYWVTTK